MESLAAIASPCARSLSAEDAAASGATLSRVTQCVSSSRSCSTTTGSAPASCISPRDAMTEGASPFMAFSNSSSTRLRSARPSMSRTWAASTTPPPWAIAWSSMESPSRTEPSAARASKVSASGEISTFSAAAILPKCSISVSCGTRLRSNRWQRLSTVTGTLRISVVANRNFTCGGGSSSVLRRALNAFSDSMCTSSMM